MRQIGHRSAAFTLDVCTHMMACSPEQRERLKALVDGERRWGPAPLGRLGAAAYQEPILRALATLGGSARRKEVMASLESELAPASAPATWRSSPAGPAGRPTSMSPAAACSNAAWLSEAPGKAFGC